MHQAAPVGFRAPFSSPPPPPVTAFWVFYGCQNTAAHVTGRTCWPGMGVGTPALSWPRFPAADLELLPVCTCEVHPGWQPGSLPARDGRGQLGLLQRIHLLGLQQMCQRWLVLKEPHRGLIVDSSGSTPTTMGSVSMLWGGVCWAQWHAVFNMLRSPFTFRDLILVSDVPHW